MQGERENYCSSGRVRRQGLEPRTRGLREDRLGAKSVLAARIPHADARKAHIAQGCGRYSSHGIPGRARVIRHGKRRGLSWRTRAEPAVLREHPEADAMAVIGAEPVHLCGLDPQLVLAPSDGLRLGSRSAAANDRDEGLPRSRAAINVFRHRGGTRTSSHGATVRACFCPRPLTGVGWRVWPGRTRRGGRA